MVDWIKYLVYIMSLFIPPVGVITFWVLVERGEEANDIAKWSFLAAFIGFVAWCVVAATTGMRMFWPGMYRW